MKNITNSQLIEDIFNVYPENKITIRLNTKDSLGLIESQFEKKDALELFVQMNLRIREFMLALNGTTVKGFFLTCKMKEKWISASCRIFITQSISSTFTTLNPMPCSISSRSLTSVKALYKARGQCKSSYWCWLFYWSAWVLTFSQPSTVSQ